jgi:hypothetical protein
VLSSCSHMLYAALCLFETQSKSCVRVRQVSIKDRRGKSSPAPEGPETETETEPGIAASPARGASWAARRSGAGHGDRVVLFKEKVDTLLARNTKHATRRAPTGTGFPSSAIPHALSAKNTFTVTTRRNICKNSTSPHFLIKETAMRGLGGAREKRGGHL